MKYAFSTLFILMTVIGLGQNPLVDSLRHALDTATAVTDKIDFSIDLASNLFGNEPDSAKMLGRFAKGLISEVADPKT